MSTSCRIRPSGVVFSTIGLYLGASVAFSVGFLPQPIASRSSIQNRIGTSRERQSFLTDEGAALVVEDDVDPAIVVGVGLGLVALAAGVVVDPIDTAVEVAVHLLGDERS